MDEVTSLLRYLLTTKHSIDTLDSIVNQLKISKERILQLINEQSYNEYFQLLRPLLRHNQMIDKIALTLDLFCCTHYAQQCKKQFCPFLHLCPYNIRPMYAKCTNKTCPYDHDIFKSVHNQRILDARGLSSIPAVVLHELVRASADPMRSFWVCTDHAKKGGCPKKQYCDKLHYCYYDLIGSCTKPQCQHAVNDACLMYFRQKEINEQSHDDILEAFKKVLRQRKPDLIDISNVQSATASPKISNSAHNQRKSTNNQQSRASPSSRRSTPIASASALSTYDDILSSKLDTSPPLPDHEQDIILLDSYNKDDYSQTERYLSNEIGCPVKILASKNIFSEKKEKQSSTSRTKPVYYYCPLRSPSDVFQLLRWQNENKKLIKPLTVYASVNDAHNMATQHFQTNQLCIFRVHLLGSGINNGPLLPDSRLQLDDPLTMCFDRMWIYVYNL
ncbi:unnamed protein product [Adineta ricciae]|uniref:Uncharacterized protein n=1 Tax=Adineta ricciae TaxID=249248 RepID=A0A815ZFD4_ADIRI|nr:unnamed protein product [Adineta ricciae]